MVAKTYLILDAPDELDALDELDTPVGIITLFQNLIAAGYSVLITSRDTPELRKAFSTTAIVELHAHRENLHLFIEHRVQEEQRHDVVIRGRDLIEKVIEKANGM